LRLAAAAFFVAAGVNHFRNPDFYRQIIPPSFPAPQRLVDISGIAEIIGGMGLLIPRLRRAAAWGLIALLIAVFPDNIFMAMSPDRLPELHIPAWVLWLRLPLQGVMIAWVWFVGLKSAAHPRETKIDLG
jgi:uncharacterized membrane protein